MDIETFIRDLKSRVYDYTDESGRKNIVISSEDFQKLLDLLMPSNPKTT